MADEASRCLEDKIVSKPRDVDTAVVLGIAFPAFRGGILKYADHIGLPVVVQKLEQIYATTDGSRSVSPLMRKYAEAGRSFYSLGSKEE
jgi:3-hydroxyacyl-CoA dehydrogenase / enoyl-CoA hydratase / 3-hydroxybutyryl-CoA epimerase